MALPIVMPKLAMAMKQGKVVEWKAAEGEKVEKGRVIMVIETEKVTYEIEAPGSGFFHQAVELKVTVPVNQIVAYLAETEGELAELQARQPGAATQAASKSAAASGPADKAGAGIGGPVPEGKVRISPAAKKIAQEAGLDYSRLTGTGPDGRIVKEDILRAIEAAKEAAAAPPEAAAEETGEIIDGKRVLQAFPLQGMRAAIVEHMVRSLQTAAQLTTTCDVDMSELLRIRRSFLDRESEIGVRISITDLMVFILARVLLEQPVMNASLIEDQVVLWKDINIGVAVAVELNALETGLIVPVVRNADRKPLKDLSQEIKGLTQRGRTMKLQPGDLGGGTFTLTNFGVFGVGYSITTPIINQPEAAILGTGSIDDKAVVREGQIVIRPVMPLSLTFDHRILDGAPIGKFVFRLRELMENPHLMFI